MSICCINYILPSASTLSVEGAGTTDGATNNNNK